MARLLRIETEHSPLLQTAVHRRIRQGYDATSKRDTEGCAVMTEAMALLDEVLGLGSMKEGVSVAQEYRAETLHLASSRRWVERIGYSKMYLHNHRMHFETPGTNFARRYSSP